ncbi:MAG: hypothetical protein Q8K45_08525 [Rubrivivax sp.]|nr:hypothetical protein [Rubrivivax sp.]
MAFEPDPFRPISRTRRGLIAVLAVATAAFVTYSMTRRSGEVRNAVHQPADVAACVPGQTAGCVGSMTAVIAMPAASAPSRQAR